MKNTRMKAAYYESYGGPETLKIGEFVKPKCSKEQILIKVAATSYNAFDSYMRMGALGDIQFPHIPHIDFSGIVEETGEDITGFHEKDRVFGVLLPDFFQNSCAAEYIVVDPEKIPVAIVPENYSLSDSAAVPAAALTAYQGIMEHCKVKPGQRIYIAGGAGGVGSFAVQFAKRMGAYVISSASKESAPILNRLGVDEILDYKEEHLERYIQEKVDSVFCAAPISSKEATDFVFCLKKGGILVTTLNAADEEIAQKHGVTTMTMAVRKNTMYLKNIASMLRNGEIEPNIFGKYSLMQIVEANEAALHSHGKIVIVVDDSMKQEMELCD